MIFRETPLAGVWLIDAEPLSDERGFFARTWCREEFARRGLVSEVAQCSVSWTRARGTVRGLHYQAPPHDETKLVRCTRGAVHDVALDVRSGSPTFGRWVAAELTADNRRMLYVPAGVAHGFQALLDDTEVVYQISVAHHPPSERGVRWDDPACAIAWPLSPDTVSPRDAALPPLRG
jgi:dTDP-4-dehydrorhamnose 3,5-epimerase